MAAKETPTQIGIVVSTAIVAGAIKGQAQTCVNNTSDPTGCNHAEGLVIS